MAKPVTEPMPDRDRESHREKDREMLARVKGFDGDDDKLVEYQQDIDIDTGTESKLPKLEFDQEHKDCVEEPRRVPRRVLRRESLRASLRAWLRVQVYLRESLRGSFRVWLRVCIQVCLHAERECCVRVLGNQLSVDKCDCKRMRVQIAHTSVALNKAHASAESASSTTPLTRTTLLKCGKPRTVTTDAAKVKEDELWQGSSIEARSY